MNLIIAALVMGCIMTTVFVIYVSVVKLFKRFFLFYNHKKTLDLFEYFLEKSYHLTYENSIITWIANGLKNIPAEERESIERDFVKQTLMIMGKSNREIIASFFGDEQFVINFIILFIRKKIADDGLADAIRNANVEDSAQITK